MFNFLGYPKNKVVPENQNINSDNLNLKFNKEDKIIYIHIHGVGAKSNNNCYNISSIEKEENINIVYEYVDYGSVSIIGDIIQARKDIKNLSNKNSLVDDRYLKRKNLVNLENIIIKNIKDYPEHKIVLIGISHGSILIHGVLIKLKMHINHLITNALKERVYVLTLGSPRYLPINLLTEDGNILNKDEPNILNFYNIKDLIVKMLRSKILSLTYISVPDITKKLNFINRYNYDEEKRIVYVNNLDEFIIDKYGKESTILTSCGNIAKYHAFHYNFYPVIDFYHLHIIQMCSFIDITKIQTKKYKIEKCNNLLIGGNNNIYILYLPEKKNYILKNNKNGKYIIYKKKKVYLREIRGKYRYVK